MLGDNIFEMYTKLAIEIYRELVHVRKNQNVKHISNTFLSACTCILTVATGGAPEIQEIEWLATPVNIQSKFCMIYLHCHHLIKTAWGAEKYTYLWC